jgi:hypothetical protein
MTTTNETITAPDAQVPESAEVLPSLCSHIKRDHTREYVGLTMNSGRPRLECVGCFVRGTKKSPHREVYLFRNVYLDRLSPASKQKVLTAQKAALAALRQLK